MPHKIISWFRTGLRRDWVILGILAVIKLLLHFFTNGQYGYHSDELYYIASGEHLRWGYTEFPPFIAVVAHLSQTVLGDSLFAFRFFPAIAGALLVFFTGVLCRQLGGGRYAQALAALLVLISPYFLTMHTLLTMNAFEPLWWTLVVVLLVQILKVRSQKLWLGVGLLMGLGFLTKFSILFLAGALCAGLLLTPHRRVFRQRWIWLGMGLAIAMAAPTLIWQAQHHWPFLEQQAAASIHSKKPILTAIVDLLVQPTFLMHPITLPIWLSGFYFYFKSKDGRPYRLLGWIVAIIFALLILLNGKSYYFAPIVPVLFAGGAIMVENWVRYSPWQQRGIPVALVLSLIPTLPMTVPILPMAQLLKIAHWYRLVYSLPDQSDATLNNQEAPWHFQRMLGWDEMVANVSQVYHQLPTDERDKAAIVAWNYRNAGAIDRFAAKHQIPKVISGAHAFYFWGPRAYTGEVVISLGGDAAYLQTLFQEVKQVGTVTHAQTVGINSNIPIYLCRRLRQPLPDSWPNFKVYFDAAVPE